MIVASFLPIVSLLLVLVAVFALAYFFTKKMITVKVTHWLFIIYIGVLLASLVSVSIIPTESLSQDRMKAGERENLRNEFYESIYQGESPLLEGKYLLKKDSFDFDESLLVIETNVDFGTSVFVERTTGDDKKIEAFILGFGININGYDFTDELIPLQIGIKGDTLTVLHPEFQEIGVSMIKSEFTITQFTGKSLFEDSIISHDDQVVYLRVPENVRIKENPNLYIEYTGD